MKILSWIFGGTRSAGSEAVKLAQTGSVYQRRRGDFVGLARAAAARGLPFDHLLSRERERELRVWLISGLVKRVHVVANPRPCLACQALDGRVFSLNDAIVLGPLPVEGCTCELEPGTLGWCQCVYKPLAD